MRLDVFLVEKGFFDSRNKAQEAISRWEIKVNGKVAYKFSLNIKDNDIVEVYSKKFPRGYYKLEKIDKRFNLFKQDINKVLDLWSSAWWFLYYSLEKIDFVLWIEISRQFENELNNIKKLFFPKVEIIYQDIFKMDVSKLKRNYWKFDLILADLTLEPEVSFKGLCRFLNLLADNWKIMWVYKWNYNEKDVPKFIDWRFKIIDKFKSTDRQEYYFLLTV